MSSVVKTYNTAAGELKFEFIYAPLLGSLDDFDIVDISALRYGYDSDDPKAISVYPANIEITIDDLTGDNYTNFRKFFSHYNAVYPFNHYDVLHLVITLNGEVIFKGLIDEVSNDHSERSVSVSFVDGINRYKDAQVGNPYLLQKLYSAGIAPRTPVPGGYAYAFGFGSLQYLTVSTVGQSVLQPGYFPGAMQSGDKDVNLEILIKQLIWSLRGELNIDFQNELKYGDIDTPTAEMVSIDRLNVRRVMSNLFGRYMAIQKIAGRYNQIAEVTPCQEYQKPEHYEIVYEDDDWIVYRHTWSGVTSDLKKFEKGLDDNRISDILKTLALNTYSYFGLRGVNTFFWRHKRYSGNYNTFSSIAEMSKSLSIDQVNQVLIKDYYTGNYARKGNDYNIDDKKLEYKIPLNAFRTDNGWEYRMNYYSGSVEKRVIHFYDPVLDIRDIPQEYLSLAEWQYHRNHLSQYEIELSGIDYHMDRTYRIAVYNYNDYVRPVTIEKHLLDGITNMTALQI